MGFMVLQPSRLTSPSVSKWLNGDLAPAEGRYNKLM